MNAEVRVEAAKIRLARAEWNYSMAQCAPGWSRSELIQAMHDYAVAEADLKRENMVYVNN